MAAVNSYKVILVGESAVGKTALVRRYVYGDFVEFHAATIVTSFVSKKFDEFRMDIWDSAGQERFQSLVQMYFRGAQTALVVFSAGDFEASFKQAKFWVQTVREKANNGKMQIILVENKIDIPDRQTNDDLVKQYCEENELVYMQCSAKTGKGVEDLFNVVVENAKRNHFDKKEEVVAVKPPEKKSGCC